MSLLRKSFPTTTCCLKVNIEGWFIVVVQSPIRVQLFVTPWTEAHQAFLSLSVEWWYGSLTIEERWAWLAEWARLEKWLTEEQSCGVWVWQDEGHTGLREHRERSSQRLRLCPRGPLEHLLASVYCIMLTNASAIKVVFLRVSILREECVIHFRMALTNTVMFN